ncbi:MAG: hypothetical protein P4M01_13010 [Acidobacteriota bacterium]|nr:hypothetical protein [Acidobacteriota bacterium]
MDRAFHALTQPAMAMRMMLEVAQEQNASGDAAQATFEQCLLALDRLTDDMNVLRQIVCLEPSQHCEPCNGAELLRNGVAEMEGVAEEHGMAVELQADELWLLCDPRPVESALFVLLDEMAAAGVERLEIRLRHDGTHAAVEIAPAGTRSIRTALCHALFAASGARTEIANGTFRAIFPVSPSRQNSKYLEQIRNI